MTATHVVPLMISAAVSAGKRGVLLIAGPVDVHGNLPIVAIMPSTVAKSDKANAWIMAAAPELLAALEGCSETLRSIRMAYGFGSSEGQSQEQKDALEREIDLALEPARAAIAKAKGGR